MCRRKDSPRPNIRGVLQPTYSNQIGEWQIERLPKLETFGITHKGVEILRELLRSQSYQLIDVAPGSYDYDNLGRLPNGQIVVIDPGAVQKLNYNPAQLAKGGIDLSSENELLVQNNGQSIKFHIDPAQLQELQNSLGFVPVIINIQPMNNVREFLGITDV